MTPEDVARIHAHIEASLGPCEVSFVEEQPEPCDGCVFTGDDINGICNGNSQVHIYGSPQFKAWQKERKKRKRNG